MAIIADVDLEEGDFSDFSRTVTGGGDLSVTKAAALAGTVWGLQCYIDDTTAIYGEKDISPPASGQLRARIYLDPNTMTIPNNQNFVCLKVHCSASPEIVAGIWIGYDGSSFEVRSGGFRDDNTSVLTALYDITDAPHYVEFLLVRATNDASADGYVSLWIDGVFKATASNIDNFDAFANIISLRMGAALGIDSGTLGTLFVDQLIANNDGSLIGPVVAGLSMAVAMHHYRKLREQG